MTVRRHLTITLLAAGLLAGCQKSEDESSSPRRSPQEIAQARIDQLLRTAESLAQAKKYEQAMTFIGDALSIDATNRRAMLHTAEYSLMLARQHEANEPIGAHNLFRQAGEAGKRLREHVTELNDEERSVLAMVRYAEARMLTQEQKPEEAVAALKDSMDLGFDQFEILVNDPVLDPLRKREDFRALTAGAESEAEAEALKQAKATLASFQPYPFSFELPDLDGQPVKLDEIRGKITIVDVWGTWCPPCRIELPHFVDLYERYHDRGLEIVGVTYEQTTSNEQATAKVREFLEKEIKLPYRLVLGDEATMVKMEPFEGFPTTLFLDATGQVRAKLVGAQPPRDLEALVMALLDEPPAKPASDAEGE